MIRLILKCELRKVFSKRLNQIVLSVAFLLAITFSCFAIGSMRYIDRTGVAHTGITAARKLASNRNVWKGNLTVEKIEEIVKNRKELTQRYPEDIPDTEYGKTIQSYNDITDYVVNILTPDSDYDESVLFQVTDEQIEKIYTTYEDNMQKMIEEYGKTPVQQKFLEKQYKKIKIPPIYEAKDSWDTMNMYAETYGLILIVIIGFLAAGIFAEEFRNRSEDIFFSTKYGRTKATKNKIAAGILMTNIVYWAGIGTLSLISFGIMGVSGLHTPYQIDQPYSIYSMTYGQYYLLIVVCGYIASLFAASLTMLITAKMRTANVAICIPFFIFCMTPFIGRTLTSFTTFFNLTPNVLMNLIEYTKTPIVFQIGDIVFREIPFLMLIYTIVSVVLLPFVYRSYCRNGLKKK